jgi:hypothetical protein
MRIEGKGVPEPFPSSSLALEINFHCTIRVVL